MSHDVAGELQAGMLAVAGMEVAVALAFMAGALADCPPLPRVVCVVCAALHAAAAAAALGARRDTA